jgi:hypothetical protein
MGTLIRHARKPTPVFPLAIPMVKPSFRAPLVTAVGAAALPAPGLGLASRTAIPLSAIAVSADPEHRVASQTSPLTKDRLAMKVHARRQAGVDNGERSWQVRTSLMCGYLLKVARLNARPLPRPGTPRVPAFDEELYTSGQDADDRRMICACGADDVVGLRYTGDSSENDDFR